MPHAPELESAIIGACMLERDAFALAAGHVFPEVFYDHKHRVMFKAMRDLFDNRESIDLLTVINQLRQNGDLETAGGPYEVTKTTNAVMSSAHLEDHCHIVLENYLRRKGIEMAGQFEAKCYDESFDPFDTYNSLDNQLIITQESVLRGSMKDMDFYTKKVYEDYERVKNTGVLGIQTDITPVDKIFGGLVSPDLFIVAARPAMGKTGFVISITVNTSVTRVNPIPCAWFSLEMDGTQLSRRMASQISGVDHGDIRRGVIPPHQEVAFFNALSKIAASPVYIEDQPAVNIRDIRTRSVILKRKYNIQYIVVDYLQLMEPIDHRNKSRNDAVGEISRGLKQLAKELEIPVIALSQLSREVEKRSDKMPQLSDLRESGSIEQDADNVLFLYRPEYYGIIMPINIGSMEYDTRGLCVGVSGKSRHGPTMNFAMHFDGPTMRFSNHYNDTQPQLQRPSTKIQVLPPVGSVNGHSDKHEDDDDWSDQPF